MQIPFLDLAETQEVTKVRYKLLGGTPFAKTDINEVRFPVIRKWTLLDRTTYLIHTRRSIDIAVRL